MKVTYNVPLDKKPSNKIKSDGLIALEEFIKSNETSMLLDGFENKEEAMRCQRNLVTYKTRNELWNLVITRRLDKIWVIKEGN